MSTNNLETIISQANIHIISDIIKEIIKSSYFFNDVTLAFHSHVIKTFLKSDIIVV